MLDGAIFSGWSDVGRTLAVGACAYVALVVLVRVSGKRTLSKLNAFDLIVTVALGSTLASVLTSKSVSLVQGLTALALLVGLQFAVTWTAVRSERFNRAVKAEPTVLLRNGEPLPSAMRRERVARDELMSAIRDSGGTRLQDADLVILEADGSLTAILAGN